MNPKVTIQPLTKKLFKEAVDLVLKAGLDTKEEIKRPFAACHYSLCCS